MRATGAPCVAAYALAVFVAACGGETDLKTDAGVDATNDSAAMVDGGHAPGLFCNADEGIIDSSRVSNPDACAPDCPPGSVADAGGHTLRCSEGQICGNAGAAYYACCVYSQNAVHCACGAGAPLGSPCP